MGGSLHRPTTPTSELDAYVTIAKALADPTRLRILQLIGSAEEYACTALEKQVPVSKSTISHHVRVLNHAGLVDVRREGKYFHYRLRREAVERYLPRMLERL